METKQFIWEREIKSVKWNVVEFIDGTKETFVDAQLEYIITNEPKDATEFQEIEVKAILKDLLDIVEKHDLRKWLISIVVERLVWSYNEAFLLAVGKAFWTYKEGVYPETFQENIKISDIKRLSKNL